MGLKINDCSIFIRVSSVAYANFVSLSNDDKYKLLTLLANEFVYLTNCIISEKSDNGFIASYTNLNKFLKDNERI